MLYHWLTSLQPYFSPLNLFRYITFRAAIAGALSIMLPLVIGKPMISLVRKLQIGQNVREEVPERHKSKAGTPTMGGVLMLFSALIGIFLLGDLTNRGIQLGIGVLVALGLLGLWDDYVKVRGGKARGINKRTKLIFQFLVALGVGATLYFAPPDPAIKTKTNFIFLKNIVVDFGVFYIPLVMFTIVATSNAVNLSDGLDGLAAGLMSVAFAAYTVLCYVAGNGKIAQYLNIQYVPVSGEMTVFCFALTGACLGFLWFNCYPAEIFMGDTGSLPFGGALALAAILSKHELLLPLVGGVFVLETVSTLVQIIV
ncbi:MAG: phospho-N-acetylmuramoyl-pentapeptide-transferase, partial [bacterium]